MLPYLVCAARYEANAIKGVCSSETREPTPE
jgi:hypothetical protein